MKSKKNLFNSLLYAGFLIGVCCLSTAWGNQATVGNSAMSNEQIARGGGGYRGDEGYRGGEDYHGADTREQHNINQDIRRDTGQDPYRSDYNGHRYDGNYNRNSEFAPTYVAPVVPVPAVYDPSGVIDPAYNVDPYLQPTVIPPGNQ